MGAGDDLGDEFGGDVEDVSDIYERLDLDMTEEEFSDLVDEKVEEMGGLCDVPTAARLVSHQLGEKEVFDIAEVTSSHDQVRFVGETVSIGEVRVFERDDGDDGKVANIELADDTGRIRVALWDDYAESIEELEIGQVLRVVGSPREGYNGGVEVSASNVEPEYDAEFDSVQECSCIDDLFDGMSSASIEGRVLGVGDVRVFERDGGDDGKVSNLVIGDKSGWIRVALWDDMSDHTGDLSIGDSVSITDCYVRQRNGDLEVSAGENSELDVIDESISVEFDATVISDLEIGDTATIKGVVTDVDDMRKFERDDGSLGRVRNIKVRDGTDEIRVALWGDHTDINLGPGDEVVLINASIQEGWRDDVEGSVNWNGCVYSPLLEGREGAEETTQGKGSGLSRFSE